MAKLRLDVEQWGALLDAARRGQMTEPRPCLQQAIDELELLLKDVQLARMKVDDQRNAWTHNCTDAGCAAPDPEARRPGTEEDGKTLGPTIMRLLEAEFGSFLLIATLEDGNLAVLGVDSDKGTLRKNAVHAATTWADGERQKKS